MTTQFRQALFFDKKNFGRQAKVQVLILKNTEICLFYAEMWGKLRALEKLLVNFNLIENVDQFSNFLLMEGRIKG